MIIMPNGLHHASVEERKLYLAYKHMIAFGKLFLPGDFMKSKTPEVHYRLGAEFDSDSTKPCAFILARESAKCLRGDSEIQMADGSVKFIKDIETGDSVICIDENTLKLKTDIVEMKEKTEVQPVYEIITSTGRKIVASKRHRIFTFNGWKEVAVNLEVGDTIASPRQIPNLGKDEPKLNDAKLVAHILMEGGTTGGDVRYTNTDKEVIDDFRKCAKGIGCGIRRISKNNITFRMTGHYFGGKLYKNGAYHFDQKLSIAKKWAKENNLYGKKATEKRIPEWIFGQPDSVLWEFVNIVMVTDGWFSRDSSGGGITLANEKLVLDIRKIFTRLGILTRFKKRSDKFSGAWTIEFSSDGSKLLLDNCSLMHKREKAQKALDAKSVVYSLVDIYPHEIVDYRFHGNSWFRKNGIGLSNNYRLTKSKLDKMIELEPENKRFRLYRDADVYWEKIESITKLEPVQTYDIETQKYHNFFVDGLCSHNTTLTKCSIIQDFCFAYKAEEWGWAKEREQLFHVWVSKSQVDSYANMQYIRLNLEHNKRIRHYFGNLRGSIWNMENIVTAHNQKLQSFSTLKSVRGQTWADLEKGTLRLSRAFIDDAETETNTKTEGARKFIKKTVMNAIYPAIEKDAPRRRLFLTGTPVHWDSMAQNLMDDWAQAERDGTTEDYPWRVHVYGSTQPDMEGGVLWHSFRPRRVLDEIKAVYEQTPEVGVAGYYQEYELQVTTEDNATWSRKHLLYHDSQYEWDEEDQQSYLWIDKVRYPVNTFLGCDPATDIDNKDSDYSVIMIIAVDAENRKYVMEYVRNKYMPTAGMRDEKMEIIGKKGVADYIIELGQKYHINNGRVEDVAMNRSVFKDLNNLKRQLDAYDVHIAPHPPGGQNKHNRIHTYLNSDFSSGLIFIRKNMYDLENEIIKFGPKMSHDDCLLDGTLIKTISGYKNISEIEAGELVLTHTGNYKTVEKVFEKDFDDEFVTLRMKCQLDLDVSSDHKIYCALKSYVDNKYDKGRSKRKWVESGQVLSTYKNVIHVEKLKEPNYKMYSYHGSCRNNQAITKIKFDKDFAGIIGYFLAEGHATLMTSTGTNGRITFASHLREVEKREFVKKYFKQFGISCSENVRGNSVEIVLHSVLFHSLFMKCYDRDREKIIPEFAFDFGTDLKEMFEWWVRGDGWKLKKVSDSNYHGRTIKSRPYDIQCGSVSKKLALGMRDIAFSLGWYVLIRKLKRYRYGKPTKDFYQLDVFYEKPFYGKMTKFNDGNFGSSVQVQDRRHYKGKVYDLQVADDHSFVAEGMVVHNCIETLYYSVLGAYRYKGDVKTKDAPLPPNLLDYKRKKLEALRARNRKVQTSWITM